MLDSAKREAIAPKALPALRRMIEIVGQLEKVDTTNAVQLRQTRMQYQTMAVTYGDADARAALEAQSKGSDPDDAAVAQAALLLADWFRGSANVDAQGMVLDRAEALAKQHPKNDTLTQIIGAMGEMGPASAELKRRSLSIATGMDNDQAKMLKMQVDANAKLRSVEGKPLTISGTTLDGQPFSTGAWDGKVILVDFWATWCGPCLVELPRVKKAYQDYHSKGLEVLGVSNDYRANDLKQFVQGSTDMPWPQLFDAQAAQKGEWNPITMGFGITGIPAMFLIDRKGICRTVDARANFEEMIPKLLAE